MTLDQYDELAKAVLDATNTALFPEALSPIITQRADELANFLVNVPKKRSDSDPYQWDDVTALPEAHWQGEKSTPTAQSSTPNRRTVTTKVIKVVGGVTRKHRLAAAKFIDSYINEVELATKGTAYKVDGTCLWGSATADAQEFTGIEPTAATNKVDRASATVTLAMLDDLIDRVHSEGGAEADPLQFYMSPQMISKVINLQVANQLQEPLLRLNVRDGWEVAQYRGVPMIPHMSCRPRASWSGSITLTASGAGGTLAANTYYFRMSYVDMFGEQNASAEANVTTTGTTSKVNMSWTAQVLDGNSESKALYYKIYEGTSTGAGNTSLKKVTASKTYDGNGEFSANVTTYSYTGSETEVEAHYPYVSGDETVFLLDMDPNRSMELAYLSEKDGVYINYIELARTSSNYDFQIEGILAMALKDEAVLGVNRRIKAS